MNTAPPRAGSPGPSYQDYLDRDSREVPACLRERAPADFDDTPIEAARYTSQAFFDQEAERLWPRVWQMACREEDIPEVGDVHVYEIVGRSLLVTRTAPDRIRAYHNVCLHRGRKLCDASGHYQQFRCGFHGFTWDLDGRIARLPCRWDFAHLGDEDLTLPEAQVDTWGGFVFINMDLEAPPLAHYLGVLPAHFSVWRLEDRYKAAHVAKRIPCNWKVAQEAFMESFHVIATHPQILGVIADANAQYDVYGDHVNRNLSAFAAPSPHLGRTPPSEEEIARGMLEMYGHPEALDALRRAAPEADARTLVGEINRRALGRSDGRDYSQVSDAELLDALVYNVFPNFSPWGGVAPNIVYRWRPDGREVNACVMEVMFLRPVPSGRPRPAPAALHWLGDDEPWASAPELPILGAVIDQDMDNMPAVQAGLVASANGRVQLASYQESRIRHFHRTLDRYLATAP